MAYSHDSFIANSKTFSIVITIINSKTFSIAITIINSKTFSDSVYTDCERLFTGASLYDSTPL